MEAELRRSGGERRRSQGMFAIFGFVSLMNYILCLGKEKKKMEAESVDTDAGSLVDLIG